MGSKIDFFPFPHKGKTLLKFIRNSAHLSRARMRDVRLPREGYKQLIKLIQRLFLSGQENCQAVVFSAVEAGSGCTFICTRIAEILANHLEDSVCLVDANFRSPGLEREFELSNATVLSYDDDWT